MIRGKPELRCHAWAEGIRCHKGAVAVLYMKKNGMWAGLDLQFIGLSLGDFPRNSGSLGGCLYKEDLQPL